MPEFTPEQKKRRLDLIIDYHKDLIDRAGINRNDFRMKMAFYDKQGTYVVGMFSSEFKRDNGFFFELVDREFLPVDTDRKVYRMAPNPNYENDYKLTEKGYYHVPMADVQVIDQKKAMADGKVAVIKSHDQPELPFSEPSQNTSELFPSDFKDAPFASMTIRDFVAIHTLTEVSPKPWLNDLIKTINENE